MRIAERPYPGGAIDKRGHQVARHLTLLICCAEAHVLDVEIDDQQRLVLTDDRLGPAGAGLPGLWRDGAGHGRRVGCRTMRSAPPG